MLLVWDWTDLGAPNATRGFRTKLEKARRKEKIYIDSNNDHTHIFISLKFELYRASRVDCDAIQMPDSSTMASRHRSIIQVLDDMWLHEGINRQYSYLRYDYHRGIEIFDGDELAKLQFCSKIADFEWLKTHAP
jgi:hypothetical protein